MEDYDFIDSSPTQSAGKRRGRPPLINKDIEDSFAKTGIIRKPKNFERLKEVWKQQIKSDGITDEASSSSEPREAFSKKFICVAPYTPRGPKPGQKRKPYKKRKGSKKKPAEKDEARIQKEKETAEAKGKAPRKRKQKDQSPSRAKPACKRLKLDDESSDEANEEGADVKEEDATVKQEEKSEQERELEIELERRMEIERAVKGLIKEEVLYKDEETYENDDLD